MLGTQRTGSSAIAKLTNLHSAILSGLEWTQKVPRGKKISATKDFLGGEFSGLREFDKNYVDQKWGADVKWLGFKILFSSSNKWLVHPRYSIALWNDGLSPHLDWIKNNRQIHVVHIVRRDNLEWLKSLFMAKKTDLYSGKTYPDEVKIHINEKTAVARLRSKNWIDHSIRSLAATNPYCLVFYEDFKNDFVKTGKKIVEFFNLEPTLNFDRFDAVRQSKGDAKDYIENYQELSDCLSRQRLLVSDPI